MNRIKNNLKKTLLVSGSRVQKDENTGTVLFLFRSTFYESTAYVKWDTTPQNPLWVSVKKLKVIDS